MNTRTEAQATASIPSAMVSLIGSAVAEIRTGAKKQERERVLQAAGQEQQPGEFDDVQRQQAPPQTTAQAAASG